MQLVTHKVKIWYLCEVFQGVAARITMDKPAVIWLFAEHYPYITIMICATRDAVLQAHMLQSRPVLLERSSHASQARIICQLRRGDRSAAARRRPRSERRPGRLEVACMQRASFISYGVTSQGWRRV